MNQPTKARNNPVSGATYVIRGIGLITRKGIRRYVAIPLLINILLFGAAIYYAVGQIGLLESWIDGYLPSWLDWLTALVWPVLVITAALVVFFAFSLVANLIAAPFNSLLANAVEQRLTGGTGEGSGKTLVRDALASISAEIRKLVYFVAWSIPLLLLSVIPVVNVAAPVLWVLFAAWMLAVEYTDFPMGNHGITFPSQRRLLRKRRLLSLGFGGAASVALMLPVLNFLVIPVCVAGASAMWAEQLSREAAQES